MLTVKLCGQMETGVHVCVCDDAYCGQVKLGGICVRC